MSTLKGNDMNIFAISRAIQSSISGKSLHIHLKHPKKNIWTDNVNINSVTEIANNFGLNDLQVKVSMNSLVKVGFMKYIEFDYCYVDDFYNKYDPDFHLLTQFNVLMGVEKCL